MFQDQVLKPSSLSKKQVDSANSLKLDNWLDSCIYRV